MFQLYLGLLATTTGNACTNQGRCPCRYRVSRKQMASKDWAYCTSLLEIKGLTIYRDKNIVELVEVSMN